MGSVLLLLLLAAPGTIADIEVIPYSPSISNQNLEGKVTGSTFVLEPPKCVFDPYVNVLDNIWLVVTFANATSNFKNPTNPQQIPPYEDLYTTYGYMTLKSTISQYPCNNGRTGNVLRVGNESTCKNDDSRTNCNGALPSPGPYRVKFLAMNANGSKAETRWSAPIALNQGARTGASAKHCTERIVMQATLQGPQECFSSQAWKTVDTWPGRRSGDMIVITVILSVLYGVVTAGFLSTVCYECSKGWRQGPSEDQEQQQQRPPEPFQASRYDTHHIPPPPPPPVVDLPGPPQLILTAS